MLAARAVDALAVLEVNAPVIDHPGSRKRWLDRALVVEPMRRWREWQCRQADLVVTPQAGILPGWLPADRIVELEWGADTARFTPEAAGDVPFVRREGADAGGFRRRVPFLARRHSLGRCHAATARSWGCNDVDAVLIGSGPELPRVRAAAEPVDGGDRHRRRAARAHAGLPGRRRHGRRAVRRGSARPAVARLLLVPAEAVRVHGGRPAGGPRRPSTGSGSSWATRREGVLYDAADPDGLAGAIDSLRSPALRRRLGTAARERAVREFGWDRHCERLDSAMRAALAGRGRTRGTCAS